MRNKYCSNCLRTQRFLDLGGYLVCERCSKRLERVEPIAPQRPTVRRAPWAEVPEPNTNANANTNTLHRDAM